MIINKDMSITTNYEIYPSAINPVPIPTQPQLPIGGDAIDLDALNKMKAEERQYCYTNELYFYCKAPGHDVENCKKRTADTR
jgi:hypothetical protein